MFSKRNFFASRVPSGRGSSGISNNSAKPNNPRPEGPRLSWRRLNDIAFHKLSRTTSSGNYIPEIDGLRCIAIAAVIAFHLAGYVAEKTPTPFVPSAFDDRFFQLLRTGHIGVQLFFIISGFVVAMPFAMHRLADGNKVNLRRYFLRRLTRIEPPYVIALVFWLIAFGISGLGVAPFPVLLRHFPASLFYVHSLVYHQQSYVLPPAWSLEIEIQFYILAPLLAHVFCIGQSWLRRSLLSAAIVGIAIAQKWLRFPGEIIALRLDQQIHFFLIGLLLVDFYILHWRHQPAKNEIPCDVVATACAVILPAILMYDPGDQLSVAITLTVFVAAVLRSRYWRAILRNRWIYTFGGMCYTTYLYHGFFKALPGHFTIRWHIGHAFWLNFLLQSLMLVPIIIVGSTVLFLLTEKPFMSKGQNPSTT